jgi:hypothetical protein
MSAPPTILDQLGRIVRPHGAGLQVDLLEGDFGRFVRLSEVNADGTLRFRVQVRASELRAVIAMLAGVVNNAGPLGTHDHRR